MTQTKVLDKNEERLEGKEWTFELDRAEERENKFKI